MMYWYTVAYVILGCVGFQQLALFLLGQYRKRNFAVKGKHAFITGGSQGLGLALAKEFARRGANVTIVARNKERLAKAVTEIQKDASSEQVFGTPADVTDEDAVAAAIEAAEQKHGAIDICVPCAGLALCGLLAELELSDFRKNFELNYFGVVNTVYPIARAMQSRKSGDIVFVGSGLSLCAQTGFLAYTPTKWAVRALAEQLRGELKPSGINVFMAYPPAIDTPGLVEENKRKPKVALALEEGNPTHSPESVARHILGGMAKGQFHLTCGDFGLWMLIQNLAGMSPRSNLLLDMILSPIVTLVSSIFVYMWDDIVRKHHKEDKRA